MHGLIAYLKTIYDFMFMSITSFVSRLIEKLWLKTHQYPIWAIVGIPLESYEKNEPRIIGFNPKKLILDYFEQETKNFHYVVYYNGYLYYNPYGLIYYAHFNDLSDSELKLLGRFIMRRFLYENGRRYFKNLFGALLSRWSVLFELIVIKYAERFHANDFVIEALKEFAKYTRVQKMFVVPKLPQNCNYLYPDMDNILCEYHSLGNASYSRNDKRRCFAIKTIDPLIFKDYKAYEEEFLKRKNDPSFYDDLKFIEKYKDNREVSEEDYEKFAVKDWDK